MKEQHALARRGETMVVIFAKDQLMVSLQYILINAQHVILDFLLCDIHIK